MIAKQIRPFDCSRALTSARRSLASASNIQVKRIAGSLGAEIRGIDVRRLNDAQIKDIHQAWLEHKVIFFRGQQLQPKEFLEFSSHFGKPAP